ncbi:hypothetical protein [Arsenophonus nasoniae]|uniref:Uncharacterized protein n=1 Tax=Arsenophonus nasoniae TaxID=638 RepID=A0AA95GDK5_9GAMM|nr:hypothetical protein [Arsenophonus nasoniae]WGL94448.1 hypothetical protein QE207_12055 [Arsenophonus nasoniae]
MESIITSQTNNYGKTSDESLDELFHSYSHSKPLMTDCVFGDELDKLFVKEITESALQMVDSIDKIANILTDATVTFTASNESVVAIMSNIIQTESEAIISLATVITPILKMN